MEMTTSDEEYENDIKNSPFLRDRSKSTYIRMMQKMLHDTGAPSIHDLLHNPGTYAEILKDSATTEEVLRTCMITILAFMKYSELKQRNYDLFIKWYTHYKNARRVIVKRILNHEPTSRQQHAHVPWEDVLKRYREMTYGTKAHLLMSLITLLPPRRQSDWYKVRVYASDDVNFKPELGHNYINVNYVTPYILLTDYKTAKFFHRWYMKIPSRLLKIIKDSLNDHPRDWLFVNQSTGEPYELEAFTRWSNRTLKRVTGNPNTCMNAMRHSYISYIRMKKPNMTLMEQIALSKNMGHSIVQNMGYKLNTQASDRS